ncbi:EAL domain-containing protein [Acidomonas methanolica]|uniref:EAL domain-containing protein n=1 Tax=Acidomonas methanolica TaxID=437 RepID=UPI0005AAC3A2|nr:EAL domain-containing protein [Acidomonas methanolica]
MILADHDIHLLSPGVHAPEFSPVGLAEEPSEAVLLQESFAGTLRRRRARQHVSPPFLRWQGRWHVPGRDKEPEFVGAAIEPPYVAVADPLGAEGRSVSGRSAFGRRGTRRQAGMQDFMRLRQACVEAGRWDRPLRLFVPFGEEVHAAAPLLGQVEEILAAAHFPAGRLEIAMRETAFEAFSVETAYTLAVMRDSGIGFWLSHFGSGTSSLTLLHDLTGSGLLKGVSIDAQMLAGPAWCHESEGAAEGLAAEAFNFLNGAVTAVMSLGLVAHLDNVNSPALLRQGREVGCREMSGTVFGTAALDELLSAPREGAERRKAGRRVAPPALAGGT